MDIIIAPSSPYRAYEALRGAVDDVLTRIAAIGGLLALALIHALELPDAFDSQLYLGLLFIGVIVVSLVLAGALTRVHDRRLWAAAGGFALLVMVCYVISRAFGLPGFTSDVGEWAEPNGLMSLVVEGLLICVAAAGLAATSRATAAAAEPGRTASAPVDTARGLGPSTAH